MLAIESVSKRYRSGALAIDGVTVNLEAGILGLLGPNGAGKTTLMQMIATLTKPTSGRILFQGTDILRKPDAVRSRLGYLPQDFGVYDNVTAFEFLSYLGGLKGVRSRNRIGEMLEAVNLHTAAHRQLSTFSGGMKQRLGIAQAFLNDPELLIVDEPTVGLDPEERIRFRTLLSRTGGKSLVILSTHIVSDVAAVAGRIALLAKGKLIRFGAPEEIIAETIGHVWETTMPSGEFERQRPRLRISSAIQRPDGIRVRFVGDRAPVAGAGAVEPTLEDAYLFVSSDGGSA